MKLAELKELCIDTAQGLACCADDEEFYMDMLAAYVEESRDRAEALRRCHDGRDWHNYGISAHSVKSTSRMIGAMEISRMARELELAVRAEDEAAIEGLHGDFLAAYTGLAARLGELVGG